ncbi:hypothetical protein BN159_8502 [Streptomyces davaonensis JCM 4913]|uniref:Uncharacterized protein n=1 Tax=Streptomyces davaonensis (strain DSM 101723 / JCM 4913 / KCC S-0913 / 768) TaxID=1214101 RepID=K4QU89_STRDJ|nr:hypothetical protein [Streptomyces davaonensis]CCK24382.1 hypothetical protein BN159_0003 [Streptomyces davaonensis JCM 4913]CCK32880.1 hypothetical protein BN159_8502 [Streptomyces davaonensis JCM 4913]
MENSQIPQQLRETGAPLTDAEKEQARYALAELARSERDPDALRVSHEQLEMVRPFFELGWGMGVRTGHTGAAMAGVPVDPGTVDRAFVGLLSGRVASQLVIAVAQVLDPQGGGPVLWQRVRYHGSVTRCHGSYWVQGIHAHADLVGVACVLRYDLCEVIGGVPVTAVTNVRRRSLTPLPEFCALV